MKTVVICAALGAIALALFPPAMARQEAAREETPRVLVIEETIPAAAPQKANEPSDERTVTLLTSDGTRELELDEYLTAVVLCEMPPDFEPEALRAQAVAARTFACRQMRGGKHEGGAVCTDSACCQAWRSEDELRERLGTEFDADWEKAADAVTATHDEVLTYDGALIDATFFSCSGGRTEAAVAVWGSDVPYLQSVESYGEQAALRYASEAAFTAEEFREKILGIEPEADLTGDPESWLGTISYTDGGGVDEIAIGGAPLTGVQMRSVFHLNSTQFTLEFADGAFHFSVLGYGHRVGMSQYGANYMAQQGYSYRVILPYYYRGAQITPLGD